MFKLVLAYILVIFFALILTLLEVNSIIIYIIVFLFFFTFLSYQIFIPIYFSNNLEQIEKWVIKKKHKPEYRLFYGLAHHKEEDVLSSIEELLKKPLHRTQYPVYLTIRALFQENFELAKEQIEKIKPGAYQNYYRSIILIEENRAEEAEVFINTLPKPWMKEALSVEIAKKNNQFEKAKKHAFNAIKYARGLQRYVLAKTFEREIGIKLKE